MKITEASRINSALRARTIEDLLKYPKMGRAMRLFGDAYISEEDPTVIFPIEEGVIRAFIPSEPTEDNIAQIIREFYERNPFPNYEEMENVGSLIEKSVSRGFPEMLNRAIPPNATVLEVGCGTGQLASFLSIANRRVLGVDLCLNSLRLAQRFKTDNDLLNVTFAQMNLFRLPLQPGKFDVVICTGVLHHTSDPLRGFRTLLPFVKPGGHVILGLYNRYVKVFGEPIVSVDPYIRNYVVTSPKKHAWFMDQYCNPHESLHTMDEVLDWFDGNGIHFVRALPSTVFGSRFSLEYRRSLFDDESRGSYVDRLLSQLEQVLSDTEGGLFIMIGRKKSESA